MKRIIFLSLCFAAATLSGCKKEYSAKVSFWFNHAVSNYLITLENVTALTIFINEDEATTIDPADWKVGPDCDGANLTLSFTLTNKNSDSFNYSVRDQTGSEKFAGTFSLVPDECKNIELKL